AVVDPPEVTPGRFSVKEVGCDCLRDNGHISRSDYSPGNEGGCYGEAAPNVGKDLERRLIFRVRGNRDLAVEVGRIQNHSVGGGDNQPVDCRNSVILVWLEMPRVDRIVNA